MGWFWYKGYRHMEEGELPEIPRHLKDSVLSAEAYEQQTRREFQITDYARKLQIPEESMGTKAIVYRYVSVVRDADAAAERLGRFEMREAIFANEPEAEEKLNQAALLYGAEVMILEEGFGGNWGGGVDLRPKQIHLDPIRGVSSLTGKLDRVGEPYGVRVDVPEGWREQFWLSEEPFPPLPQPAGGLWTGAPFTTAGEEPWRREGDRFHEWYWPDWPNERHDPEHLRVLAQEAQRHGVTPERPRTDPVMHTLLTGLVYGRQLAGETEQLHGLPPAPGLQPPAHERLARVAPLNRLAVGVLEDAVRPGSLSPARVEATLAAVAKPYGLVVTRPARR